MKLFLVGGFLGSGKTTAIHQAVACLQKSGLSAAVITNDQGDQLVDTHFLREAHIAVREVTGSCFCCNYNDLDKNIRLLDAEMKPHAIFAESVGSCTDLVATVLNPLLHFNEGRVEPVLSVFVDIRLLCHQLQNDGNILNDNVEYIFEKQLEEADILVVTKIDLLNEPEYQLARIKIASAFAGRIILYVNALAERDIQHWVDVICAFERNAASGKPLDVDYDRYGAGEAELAWLDGEIGIETNNQTAVKAGIELVNAIYGRILARGYTIGHLKFLINDGSHQQKISFTAVPSKAYEAQILEKGADRVLLLVNARAQTDPAMLKAVVEEAILESERLFDCKITEGRWSGFKPGYPKPTYRMNGD